MLEFYLTILRPCIVASINNIRLSENNNRKNYFKNYLTELLKARKKILFSKKQEFSKEYLEEIKNLKPNQQIELF